MRQLLLSIALSAVGVNIVFACIHAGKTGTTYTSVEERGQQGLVLFRDGIEDLIIKVEYEFDGPPPESLAWVIPVPNVPTAYAAKTDALFEALDQWVGLREVHVQPAAATAMSARPLAVASQAAAAEPPLTLLPPASVGPYEIQPIQAQGPEAGRALNEWMSEHGFAELPDATLNYYLERDWTFLAVKTSAEEGALEVAGGLPPLSIRFPTEHAVFPLKLSTHMGTFPLRLYLITADALPDEAFAGAVARGFRVAGTGPDGSMGHLGSTRGGTQFLSARDFPFAPAVAPPALREILVDASMAEESELFVREFLVPLRDIAPIECLVQ